jgi:hypothetical protein
MITKGSAIQSLRPGAEWVLRGDDLEWHDTEQTRPTDEEIAAEITRLEADYAAKQYQRDRAAAYPSLAEQMDMQYWDSVNGTTVWADTIAAIKQEHPKP